MERGSDKHSPLVDEELKHETAQQLRDEAPAEDEPSLDTGGDEVHVPGTPVGLDAEDVERRSELAGYLGRGVWPASGPELLAMATEHGAPDWVLARLGELGDSSYESVGAVWSALGGGHEEQRF